MQRFYGHAQIPAWTCEILTSTKNSAQCYQTDFSSNFYSWAWDYGLWYSTSQKNNKQRKIIPLPSLVPSHLKMTKVCLWEGQWCLGEFSITSQKAQLRAPCSPCASWHTMARFGTCNTMQLVTIPIVLVYELEVKNGLHWLAHTYLLYVIDIAYQAVVYGL